MRILLIATNRHSKFMNRLSAQPAPIGLAYIGGHLDSKKHDVKILDLMFSDDYLEETEKSVREFHPDLIGISLRNLDNVSYIDTQWALPATKEIIEKVRSISDAPIVCGGAGFSLLPEACFEYLEPNLGIAGDGGESFAQLADSLGSGETYTNLPGLVYRDVNGTVLRKGLAYSDYTEPPLLDQLDLARYDKAGFGIGIVTKLDDKLFNAGESGKRNGGWRVLRPIEEVIDDIRDMQQRFDLKKIFFIDSNFNLPLPHAKALCQSMLEADLKVRWNSYMAPVPEACDDEVLELMKEAGGTVIGVDWRINLSDVWQRLGDQISVQGNLDPVALLSGTEPLRKKVDQVLEQANNRPGHIFNLGHGILPQTPVENVEAVVRWVHAKTRR